MMNEPAWLPSKFTAPMVIDLVPKLVMLTRCEALVLPTAVLPKVSVAGNRVAVCACEGAANNIPHIATIIHANERVARC